MKRQISFSLDDEVLEVLNTTFAEKGYKSRARYIEHLINVGLRVERLEANKK